MKPTIANMSCGGCAPSITHAIASIDAAAKVQPDLPSRSITIETIRSEAEIRAVLESAGSVLETTGYLAAWFVCRTRSRRRSGPGGDPGRRRRQVLI